MPVEIIRNDITKMHVDAIVNAANSTLLGGGGVDGAIHHAAGPELLAECRKLNGCEVGQAKITKGYLLPCSYVIHTVGPVWRGGSFAEADQLASCYRNSLALASQKRCQSIAFPLISTGSYGFPKDQALKIASDVIRDFLLQNDMQVYIVVFDKSSFEISQKLCQNIRAYIQDAYAVRTLASFARNRPVDEELVDLSMPPMAPKVAPAPTAVKRLLPISAFLKEALKEKDESFSQMLLRLIDEKGISDVTCYKRANIDRKLFSKIRSNAHYKPSKRTALALAIALELSLPETNDLLKKAGFALSHSSEFDIIVEYFIVEEIYDIMQINETLFYFDQMLLGA